MKIVFLLFTLIFITNASAGELIDKTISVKSLEHLLINNLRGDVEVIGWNKEEIKIQGELDDSALGLKIKNKGHKLYIKVKMKGDSHLGDGSDLKIFVPSKTSVRFKGVDTSFSFNNLKSGIEGRTINGDLIIQEAQQKVNVSTVSGDISIKDSNGVLSIESVTGTVNFSGEYSKAYAKSMSGEIFAKIDNIEVLKTENVSGKTFIEGKLQEDAYIKLTSVSGDIKYKTVGELNAACKLESQFGGKIKNKITKDLPEKSMMQQQKLNFVSGDGSGKLIINTVTGSVAIEE